MLTILPSVAASISFKSANVSKQYSLIKLSTNVIITPIKIPIHPMGENIDVIHAPPKKCIILSVPKLFVNQSVNFITVLFLTIILLFLQDYKPLYSHHVLIILQGLLVY